MYQMAKCFTTMSHEPVSLVSHDRDGVADAEEGCYARCHAEGAGPARYRSGPVNDGVQAEHVAEEGDGDVLDGARGDDVVVGSM